MSSHLSNIFRSLGPAGNDIESGPREASIDDSVVWNSFYFFAHKVLNMAYQGVTSTGNQNHILAALTHVFGFTGSVLSRKRVIEETEEVRIATAPCQSLTQSQVTLSRQAYQVSSRQLSSHQRQLSSRPRARQSSHQPPLAPAKVRVVEQPALQTRAALDKKEEEAKQAMRRVSELEDLVENGNIRLGEFENSASRAKTELRRQVAELEVGVNSERLRYAEMREKMEMVEETSNQRIAALQEALDKDQADLIHAKEMAANAEEKARQEIIALEEASKEAIAKVERAAYREIALLKQALENDQADRADATKRMERIEEEANQRIAALEEALVNAEEVAQTRVKELEKALKDKAWHRDESRRKIAELGDSATGGRSSPEMPGGLPAQADATEMDVDPESTDGKFHSFHNLHCLKRLTTPIVDNQNSLESGDPEHTGTIDDIIDEISIFSFESDEIDDELVSSPSI